MMYKPIRLLCYAVNNKTMYMKKFSPLSLILWSWLLCGTMVWAQFTPSQQRQLDSLQTIVNTSKQDTAIAHAYLELSEILYVIDLDTLAALCNKAAAIADKNLKKDLSKQEVFSFKKTKAGALNNLGYYHKTRGRTAQGLAFYEESLALHEAIGDEKGAATCLTNLGALHDLQGDVQKALAMYERSLRIHESIGNDHGVAYALNNIAYVYQNQGEIDRALEYYSRSLTIREKIGYKRGIANALTNIGYIYYMKGDDELALDYLNKGLKLNVEMNAHDRIASNLTVIGGLYETNGETDEALKYYERGLIIRRKIEDKVGIATSLSSIGRIYLDKGYIKKAKNYISEGFAIADSLGYPSSVKHSAELMNRIAQREDDWKSALKYRNLYYTMRDSIRNAETEKEALKHRSKYEINKREQQIALLSTANELKEVKLERSRLLTMLITALLGFALVLILLAYRTNQKKKVITALLKEQNEAKTTIIKEIHHRVKNNLHIVNSLLRRQSKEVEDEAILDMFKKAQSRVVSMAILHEKMYNTDNLQNVNVKEHIEQLVRDLIKTYGIHRTIDLKFDIEPISLKMETLVPLGLIINELITNSLKYAFKGREKGLIYLKMKQQDDHSVELIIGDDGVGMNADINPESDQMGSAIVKTLVRQLNGTIVLHGNEGTAYKIVFEPITRLVRK